MTLRITERDLSIFQQNSGRIKDLMKVLPAPKKPKFGNVKVTVDGIVFDSKLEAKRYGQLQLLRKAGKVSWFIRQPVFDLNGVIYRGDFLIVWAPDGSLDGPRGLKVTVEDCKGFQTRESKNKLKQVKALYGIVVLLVKAAK
jgi:hypothetical protein